MTSVSYPRFEGKVAIVTGGGSGIGQAIAMRLAAEGATVCIADRDLAATSRAEAAIRDGMHTAMALEMDVTDRSSIDAGVRRATEQLGPVDILVNNAAVTHSTPLGDLSEDDWEHDLAVDLKGPYLCSRAVLPGMLRRHYGALLNIGSVNAFQYLGDDAYSAAKAGLMSLTKSIAVQYGPHGIRANVLAPGTVRTPAWDQRLERDPGLFEKLVQWYPVRRLGTVDDVAAAAAFLLSDEASWITGTVLTIDGGLLAGNASMARQIMGTGGDQLAQQP